MAVAAALALPQVAAAYEFDLGSDTLSFRWDNTLRVNIQDRVSGIDNDMIGNPNYDDGDRNFETGSLFTRFDVLSEMDLVWKPSWGMLGARVSAAGWWNPAYATLDGDSIQKANNLTSDGWPTLDLPNYTQRYAEGPDLVDELYHKPDEWYRRAVINTLSMGIFSSDRSIREYAQRIWRIKPVL